MRRQPRKLLREEVAEVLRRGRVARSSLLTLRYLLSPGPSRIALVVGRRMAAKAAVRNRLKRRLRALAAGLPQEGLRAVFLPLPAAAHASFRELKSAFEEAARNIREKT